MVVLKMPRKALLTSLAVAFTSLLILFASFKTKDEGNSMAQNKTQNETWQEFCALPSNPQIITGQGLQNWWQMVLVTFVVLGASALYLKRASRSPKKSVMMPLDLASVHLKPVALKSSTYLSLLEAARNSHKLVQAAKTNARSNLLESESEKYPLFERVASQREYIEHLLKVNDNLYISSEKTANELKILKRRLSLTLNQDLRAIDAFKKEATPMKTKLAENTKTISQLKHQVLADRKEILLLKTARENDRQAHQEERDRLENELADVIQERNAALGEATTDFTNRLRNFQMKFERLERELAELHFHHKIALDQAREATASKKEMEKMLAEFSNLYYAGPSIAAPSPGKTKESSFADDVNENSRKRRRLDLETQLAANSLSESLQGKSIWSPTTQEPDSLTSSGTLARSSFQTFQKEDQSTSFADDSGIESPKKRYFVVHSDGSSGSDDSDMSPNASFDELMDDEPRLDQNTQD